MSWSHHSPEYEKILDIGRPPNIKKLFPHSKALLVSGKVIDQALIAKGKAATIAGNGRNQMVIQALLRAAQKANAVIIIEIAKSEGGRDAYCAVNYWNIARQIDAIANQLGITVPVAIHADHYALKTEEDLIMAKGEIPSMFEAGITSIAIDASHQVDDKNLLASIAVNPYIPKWAGLECEVGEIKGAEDLSNPADALFLVEGLNAHGIFPDWIALNNGTTHGIEDTDAGIQVDLTAKVHEAIKAYKVSGAQHGTSGNSNERLKEITQKTRTTKANVATALQMISWGVKVNDFGNAVLKDGKLVKVPNQGVTEELWAEMVAYADERGWQGGDYKALNRPFETRILSQPAEIRERMIKGTEDFIYNLLVNVFNAKDTAPLAYEAIKKAGNYDLGSKVERIQDPKDWTEEKILAKAISLGGPRNKKITAKYDD